MREKVWMILDLPGNRRRALVLGASGYLGGHISQMLLQQDWEVFGWGTREIHKHPLNCYPHFYYKAGDVAQDSVRQMMLCCEPDIVICCVALDQKRSEQDISLALMVNVDAVWHLVAQLDGVAQKPTRFIYLSTIQVYGNLSDIVLESYEPSPINAYGLTHLMAEFAVRSFSDSKFIKPMVVRLANGYGPPIDPKARCWSLVANDFCRSAVQEKRVQLLSDGTADRDFVFADDVARAVVELARLDSQQNIFNIASGRTINLLELAFMVTNQYQERHGEKIPVVDSEGVEIYREENSSSRPSFSFDVGRIRMLGIDLNTSIEEGIQALFKSLEAQFK